MLSLRTLIIHAREYEMLRIIVDIIPSGFEPLRRRVASMTIANITNLADRSNYEIEATEAANPVSGRPPRTTSAMVNGHDRATSVWFLVSKAAAAVAKAEEYPL